VLPLFIARSPPPLPTFNVFPWFPVIPSWITKGVPLPAQLFPSFNTNVSGTSLTLPLHPSPPPMPFHLFASFETKDIFPPPTIKPPPANFSSSYPLCSQSSKPCVIFAFSNLLDKQFLFPLSPSFKHSSPPPPRSKSAPSPPPPFPTPSTYSLQPPAIKSLAVLPLVHFFFPLAGYGTHLQHLLPSFNPLLRSPNKNPRSKMHANPHSPLPFSPPHPRPPSGIFFPALWRVPLPLPFSIPSPHALTSDYRVPVLLPSSSIPSQAPRLNRHSFPLPLRPIFSLLPPCWDTSDKQTPP